MKGNIASFSSRTRRILAIMHSKDSRSSEAWNKDEFVKNYSYSFSDISEMMPPEDCFEDMEFVNPETTIQRF